MVSWAFPNKSQNDTHSSLAVLGMFAYTLIDPDHSLGLSSILKPARRSQVEQNKHLIALTIFVG